MYSTRSRYGEFGLKLVSLENNHSHQPKILSMVEEKRDYKVGYPIKG